jgi:redox-sensitive bicupin YhaK (pirin superfamily)
MRAARTIAGGYQEGRPVIQIRKSEARGHANLGEALARPRPNAWLQVARGKVRLGKEPLSAGDGAALSGQGDLTLTADTPAEVLLFDLA